MELTRRSTYLLRNMPAPYRIERERTGAKRWILWDRRNPATAEGWPFYSFEEAWQAFDDRMASLRGERRMPAYYWLDGFVEGYGRWMRDV